MVTKSEQVHGGCFCGAVRFTASLPSKWCAHCHCSMCRETHGAGYVTWAGFEEEQVAFSRGREAITWFNSSAEAQRGFCSTCGSSMFFRSERWAGELHVALGCIDGEIDRRPQANVFFDRHVSWMPIDESLKQVHG